MSSFAHFSPSFYLKSDCMEATHRLSLVYLTSSVDLLDPGALSHAHNHIHKPSVMSKLSMLHCKWFVKQCLLWVSELWAAAGVADVISALREQAD